MFVNLLRICNALHPIFNGLGLFLFHVLLYFIIFLYSALMASSTFPFISTGRIGLPSFLLIFSTRRATS